MTLHLVTFIYDFFMCKMLCNMQLDRIKSYQIKSYFKVNTCLWLESDYIVVYLKWGGGGGGGGGVSSQYE